MDCDKHAQKSDPARQRGGISRANSGSRGVADPCAMHVPRLTSHRKGAGPDIVNICLSEDQRPAYTSSGWGVPSVVVWIQGAVGSGVVVGRQIATRQSALAVARWVPSVDHATLRTGSVWKQRRARGLGGLPECHDHTPAVSSSEAVATRELLGCTHRGRE